MSGNADRFDLGYAQRPASAGNRTVKNLRCNLACGDFCEPEIWEALNALKPLRGVQGNNDEDPFFERLPTIDEFDCGRAAYCDGAQPTFAGLRAADLKIFGHSHQFCDEQLKTVRC